MPKIEITVCESCEYRQEPSSPFNEEAVRGVYECDICKEYYCEECREEHAVMECYGG